MRVIERIDNLLTTDIQYIAHQCNCLTNHSAGTAKKIFTKFPYANDYKDRIAPNKLGTISIRGNGKDQRYVINMFAQYYPGRAKYLNGKKDSPSLRTKAFETCLKKIEDISNLKEIAFPYKIGCNMGGGRWENYWQMVENFAEKVFPFVDVYIIRPKTSL